MVRIRSVGDLYIYSFISCYSTQTFSKRCAVFVNVNLKLFCTEKKRKQASLGGQATRLGYHSIEFAHYSLAYVNWQKKQEVLSPYAPSCQSVGWLVVCWSDINSWKDRELALQTLLLEHLLSKILYIVLKELWRQLE